MTYKLFIDDERDPPTGQHDWKICRNLFEVVHTILVHGMPNHISFDHDLGTNNLGIEAPTGYDIAKYLVDLDMMTEKEFFKFPEDFIFYVHSQNPVGKKNIECYLNNYLKVRNN